jgi:hypothetical protein
MVDKRVSVFSFKLVLTALILGVPMAVVGYAFAKHGNTPLGYFIAGIGGLCVMVAGAFLVVALIAKVWGR